MDRPRSSSRWNAPARYRSVRYALANQRRVAIENALDAPTHANVDAAREWAGKLLFIAAVCIFLWVGLVNVDQPILERHAFRQTQTALTAYWLRINGFSLDYETPVLGAPWSIPFEFPLYQALVAWVSAVTGAGLDRVGRLVDLVSSLLVCPPLYRSLRLLGAARGAAHFANALYLTAPVYLFWSSTFMIEGMALLFAVSAGYYMLKAYQGAKVRDVLLFLFLLTLALLQKITTGAVPALVGLALFGWRALMSLRAARSLRTDPVRDGLCVLGAAALAFGAAYGWVVYSDAVKARNEFGQGLTSSALDAWNYGTLAQRFGKPFVGDVVLERILMPSTAGFVGLLAVIVLFLRRNEQGSKNIAVLGLVLFAAPLLIFTNLHYVHDYYQVANVVFLVCAVAAGVYAVCGLFPPRFAAAGPLLMIAVVAANLNFFDENYWRQKSAQISGQNSQTLKLAEFLKVHTAADQPIIVFGYDWSSEVPYYAQRKALAVPNWVSPAMKLEAIRNPARFLNAVPAAVVSCWQRDAETIRAAIRAAYPLSHAIAVDRCMVYMTQGIAGHPE
jgi:hypothetical protein